MFQGQTKGKIMGEQSIHQPTCKDDQTGREKPAHTDDPILVVSAYTWLQGQHSVRYIHDVT